MICHAQFSSEINHSLRLTQPVAINRYLEKDRILFKVISCFNFLVFGKLCSSKAGVLFQFGPAKEWLILRARVRLNAKFNVFPLCVVFVLIQEVECDSVVKRPLQQTVERTWNSTSTI